MNNQAFNKPSESDLIPLCVPEIVGREWQYIKECLDTNWVSSVGAFVDKFEIGLASYIGVKRSVATTSGTAALHIALLVLWLHVLKVSNRSKVSSSSRMVCYICVIGRCWLRESGEATLVER